MCERIGLFSLYYFDEYELLILVLTYKTFAREFHGPDLVHLYRLVDGVGISSQALHAAAQAGVQRPTLDRYSRESISKL